MKRITQEYGHGGRSAASRAISWLKADLRKVNRPTDFVRAIKINPRSALLLPLYLALPAAILFCVLKVVGAVSEFGGLVIFPLIFGGALFGARIHRDSHLD